MKIVAFEWDNFKGEEYNGRHLIVGTLLNEGFNYEHIKINGFTIDLVDKNKNNQLKDITAHNKNLVGKVVGVSKEIIRERLISEIDKNLDILFKHN